MLVDLWQSEGKEMTVCLLTSDKDSHSTQQSASDFHPQYNDISMHFSEKPLRNKSQGKEENILGKHFPYGFIICWVRNVFKAS